MNEKNRCGFLSGPVHVLRGGGDGVQVPRVSGEQRVMLGIARGVELSHKCFREQCTRHS